MNKYFKMLLITLIMTCTCVVGCGGEPQNSKKLILKQQLKPICAQILALYFQIQILYPMKKEKKAVGDGNMQMYPMRNTNC